MSSDSVELTAEIMENSPTGNPTKGSKGKVVRAFFRKLWTAVKPTFLRHDPNRVVCLKPQPDLEDPELMPVSRPVRNMRDADPELGCLPGQVCEDLESLCVPSSSRIEGMRNTDPGVPELVCVPGQVCVGLESMCVSGFSKMEQTLNTDPELGCLPGQVCEDLDSLCVLSSSRIEQTPDADPVVPELSAVSYPSSFYLDDKEAKKGRKRRAVRAFFRRLGKSAKQLFLCYDPDSVQHLTPQSDLDNSELFQVSSEIKPEPEPERVCEDLPSSMQAEASDPEALPVGLQYGTRISVVFLVGEMIGSGSFGMVYEGTHIFCERIKVAIKHIHKREQDRYLDTPDHPKPVLAEVAMMLRLGQAPSCPNIITLHHWIEDESSFSLIMEKPDPCQNLRHYIVYSDEINEAKARWMIRQLVQAVKHCFERGVFHGDIHSGNILVVTDDSLKLKLIDFGCSRLISSEGFNSSEYQGAHLYTPPEVMRDAVFHAEPAYVWAVGVVLFEILHARLPFKTMNGILRDYLDTSLSLSSACRDLIFWCLVRDPAERLTLEQLEKHRWFDT